MAGRLCTTVESWARDIIGREGSVDVDEDARISLLVQCSAGNACRIVCPASSDFKVDALDDSQLDIIMGN